MTFITTLEKTFNVISKSIFFIEAPFITGKIDKEGNFTIDYVLRSRIWVDLDDHLKVIQTYLLQNSSVSLNFLLLDEPTFQLNGNINRHNFRYLSTHTQYPQELNVWQEL